MATWMRALLVVLLLAAHATVLHADPILISDGRYVLALASIEPPGDRIDTLESRGPDVPFGPFDATVSVAEAFGESVARSTAFQRSVVSPTRFTGTGSLDSFASANGTWVGAAANTAFAITFDLAIPHRFRFTGEFLKGGNGFTEFEVAFAGEGSLGEGSEFGTSGILSAGRHEFYISVLTEAYPGENGLEQATGSYDVDLELEPVPEPGTLLLMATGLSAVVARRLRLLIA